MISLQPKDLIAHLKTEKVLPYPFAFKVVTFGGFVLFLLASICCGSLSWIGEPITCEKFPSGRDQKWGTNYCFNDGIVEMAQDFNFPCSNYSLESMANYKVLQLLFET